MNRHRARRHATPAPPRSPLSRSRVSRARAAHGFTLIEILIVVTLIAALTLVLMGAMSGGMDGLKLRSNAKKLVAELRHARAQAISTGTVQRFTVVPRQRTWTGAKSHSGTFPKMLDVTFTGVRQVQAREGEGVILFFEDGASTGGRIQLRVKKAAMNVDVAWLTGEVTLHRGEAEQ
jgi:general secretion pathway protein H